MTCKDCYHYSVCSKKDETTNYYGKATACGNVDEICKSFKDKSLIAELPPCKLGQIVYDVVLCDDDIYRIFRMKISKIEPFGVLYKSKYFPDYIWNVFLTDNYSYAYRTFSDIGKKLFFSKEEAEIKLKELRGNERY